MIERMNEWGDLAGEKPTKKNLKKANDLEADLVPLIEMADFVTGFKKNGRPEYEPTPQLRAMVVLMVGMGAGQKDVAKAIGISDTTLRKHYQAELDEGKARMDAHVFRALFKAIGKGDAQLIKLYLERMCADSGWKPDSPSNIAQLPPVVINIGYVKPGDPVPVIVEHEPLRPSLTKDEP